MKKNLYKKRNIVIRIFFIILLISFIILLFPKNFQNDTLFDISLGKKYITSGLNTDDSFSIHENLKYTPQHFLVNIITYLIYNKLNFCGLYILGIILACIIALLLYILNKLYIKNKLVSYLFVYFELLMFFPFLSVRAQMYSYILFLFEFIFIELFLRSKNYKYLIPLSILPLFIINIHSGTIWFYFIIIFVYLFNFITINSKKIVYHKEYAPNLKYLFIPIIIGFILIFLNPFGIPQLTYTFKTLNNSFINTNISEFQPITLTAVNGIFFYLHLFILFIALLYTNKKIKLEHILFFLGTTFMTLLSLRHASLFIICTTPCIIYLYDSSIYFKEKLYKGITEKGKIVLKYTITFLYLFIIFFSTCTIKTKFPDSYLPKTEYPINSVEYIKENIGNNSRLYNQYEYGSLLMFNNIKCFIDSRADLYTKEYTKDCTIADDYINIINCTGNYEELLSKYDIEYLLIDKESALAKNIFNNIKYEKVFEDDISYVIKVNY